MAFIIDKLNIDFESLKKVIIFLVFIFETNQLKIHIAEKIVKFLFLGTSVFYFGFFFVCVFSFSLIEILKSLS